MKFEIEIPEKELKEAVLNVIANKYYSTYSMDRRSVDKITAECVREIIYKDKERIVDRIVAQVSKECKNKVLEKILEGLNE